MKLKITLDGQVYEVEVEATEDPAPILAYSPPRTNVPAAPPPAPAPSLHPGDNDRVCRSPISGIAIRVAVQSGQQIKVGDVLVVLEAMKMETNITAPFDARIKTLHIAEGDAVQGGQVLVEFD